MSRFGVWIHPETNVRLEAWGELCMSTAPDLRTCVVRMLDEHPGEELVVDLRRVWFCDVSGLRTLWWLTDHGEQVGTRIEVRGSAAIARVGRLVERVRAAEIA